MFGLGDYEDRVGGVLHSLAVPRLSTGDGPSKRLVHAFGGVRGVGDGGPNPRVAVRIHPGSEQLVCRVFGEVRGEEG